MRGQEFLLPPNMTDWLPAGRLVWLVLEVVDRLDTAELERRHKLGGPGRQAFCPRMLLGLALYAYASGLRSSRAISRGCQTDVALRIACAGQMPGHGALSRFLREAREEVEDLFAQVLEVCARAGLGRVGTVSVDGTKIEANASLAANRGREWLQKAREQAAEVLDEALAADAAEDALFGPERSGDELPEELARPGSRAERVRRRLAELDAEANAQAQAAAQAADARLERIRAGEPVSGRDPAGADPLAAAQARAQRWGDKAAAAPAADARRDARKRQRRHQEKAADLQAAAAGVDPDQAARARAEEFLALIRSGTPVYGKPPAWVDPVEVARARIDRWQDKLAAATTKEQRRDSRRRLRVQQRELARLLAPDPDPDPAQAGESADPAGQDGKQDREQDREQDGEQDGPGRRRRPQRNITDPDSRIMKARSGNRTYWAQAYNCQLGVSDDHLITAYAATQDHNDVQQLLPTEAGNNANVARMAAAAGKPLRTDLVRADAGYLSEANLTAPGPDRLIAVGTARDIARAARDNPATGPPPPDADPIHAMAHRLRDPDNAALYRRRAATVETVIGHVKDRVGLRRFLTRGLSAVHAELGLAATAYNLLRLQTAINTGAALR
jgi:transposase